MKCMTVHGTHLSTLRARGFAGPAPTSGELLRDHAQGSVPGTARAVRLCRIGRAVPRVPAARVSLDGCQ